LSELDIYALTLRYPIAQSPGSLVCTGHRMATGLARWKSFLRVAKLANTTISSGCAMGRSECIDVLGNIEKYAFKPTSSPAPKPECEKPRSLKESAAARRITGSA
jgi:hypothetical protein